MRQTTLAGFYYCCRSMIRLLYACDDYQECAIQEQPIQLFARWIIKNKHSMYKSCNALYNLQQVQMARDDEIQRFSF